MKSKKDGRAYRQAGFTLIELLVVIAVIGILAAVVLASLNSARSKARDTQRIAQLREVQKALEMYYADNGSYPVGALGAGCASSLWDTSLTPLVSAGYLSSIPKDPNPITSGVKTYCYNYSSSPNTSAWNCGGVMRTNYEYVITFSLENNNPNILSATGDSTLTFNYCLAGPRK